jgi:hypothetical protein
LTRKKDPNELSSLKFTEDQKTQHFSRTSFLALVTQFIVRCPLHYLLPPLFCKEKKAVGHWRPQQSCCSKVL